MEIQEINIDSLESPIKGNSNEMLPEMLPEIVSKEIVSKEVFHSGASKGVSKACVDNTIRLIIGDIHQIQSFNTKQKHYWIRLENYNGFDLTNHDCQYISDQIYEREGVHTCWTSNFEVEIHL